MRGLHDRFIPVHPQFLLNGNAYAISASSNTFFPPVFPNERHLSLTQIYFNYPMDGRNHVKFPLHSKSNRILGLQVSENSKFELQLNTRCRVSIFTILSHKIAATIRSESQFKRMGKGDAWKRRLRANLLLSVGREVVPFYRPDTDGEIFVTEKSSVTQISTRSCRSIRFADSARRQRVGTRSVSVDFLSAFRGKRGPETDARG